jgi:hypothetical protein
MPLPSVGETEARRQGFPRGGRRWRQQGTPPSECPAFETRELIMVAGRLTPGWTVAHDPVCWVIGDQSEECG